MLRKKEVYGSACGSSGACGRLYRAQSLQYPLCGTCPYAGQTEQSANCTLYEPRFPTDLQGPRPAAVSILTGRPRGRFCSGSVGVSTSISVEASLSRHRSHSLGKFVYELLSAEGAIFVHVHKLH